MLHLFSRTIRTVTSVIAVLMVMTSCNLADGENSNGDDYQQRWLPISGVVVDWNALYAQTAHSVFLVDVDGESGTGWLIAPNRVLTAYHVIEADPQQIILRHPDLGFFKAAVIHVDSKKDMALLGFQLDKELGSPVSPLVLGNVSTSDIASPVMILGYGSAGFNANEMGAPRARIGALSQIVDTGTEHGLNLLLDIVVTSGDSGGPVINHLGQVIGMTRALSIGEKFVYAIHEDDIRGLTHE